MTLGLALLRALKNHGAQEIFGIPGDFILPLFKQIEESNILPLVTLSHEPALGFAADAAARMHCGLGVVAVTYGAGALNVVNAVASAYAERSPVVLPKAAEDPIASILKPAAPPALLAPEATGSIPAQQGMR